MNGALSTIAPFFAVFVVENIEGGNPQVVGFAVAAYWIVKSIFQLPIARWLDKTDGEFDEFWALAGSYFLSASVPIIYFFAESPWHIYLAQGLLGFFYAWAVPAWYSIFTRHLDKFRIGFEWSLYSVFSIGASASLAAAGAGILVERFGFKIVFLLASVIIAFSAISLLTIKKHLFKAPKKVLSVVIPEKKHKFHGTQ